MADNEVNTIEDSADDFEKMLQSLNELKAQEESEYESVSVDSLMTKSIDDFTDDDIDALLNMVESGKGSQIFTEDKTVAEESTDENNLAETLSEMSEELQDSFDEMPDMSELFPTEKFQEPPKESKPQGAPEPKTAPEIPEEPEIPEIPDLPEFFEKPEVVVPKKEEKAKPDKISEDSLIEDDELLDSLLSKVASVDDIDWDNNGDDFFKSNTVYDGPESMNVKIDTDEAGEDKPSEDGQETTDKSEKSDKDSIIKKIFALIDKLSSKASSKTEAVPMILLWVCLGVFFVMTTVLGILLFIQKGKVDDLKAATAPAYEVVSLPEVSVLNANYIFINQQQDFRGDSLLLTKFSMDELGTYFYFDRHIPVDELDFVLKDGKGNVYCMDTLFASNMSDDKGPTILKFQPFVPNVKIITLSIYDSETLKMTKFGMQLQSNASATVKRFINEPILLQDIDDSISIELESGSFGTTGSKVQYKLAWLSDTSELTILPINGNIENNFEIYSNGSKLFMTRPPMQTYYPKERALSGSLDFYALKTLVGSGTLKIKIKNIYRSMNKSTMVDVPRLLMDDLESQQIINIATSKVVLERIGKFASTIALIYHAENVSVAGIPVAGKEESKEVVKENKSDKFVEAILDCDLIITREDGVEIIVPGDCRAKKEGGDVRFFLDGVEGIPDTLLPTQVKVRINSILLKVPDAEVAIDVESLPTKTDQSDIYKASTSIVKSFTSRLKLKEGGTDKETLIRNKLFSEDVLNNSKLAKNYTAEEITGETSMNAYVMSITQSETEEGLYYAVVQEVWVGNTSAGEKHYHRTHKIEVKKVSAGYTIIRDETINIENNLKEF